jgi:glycosyltransferase involved in cell wall biosynthesis
MPPKILVISNYRSTITVRPEAEIYIGLAKLGFDVEIMTYGDAEYVQNFRDAGIHVIEYHPEKKFDAAAVQLIRKHLVEGKHDILQMFNSKAYINGIKAAKDLPVKVVLYRGYQGNLHWWDPAQYLKYFHPRVDRIICNSIGVEEEFRKSPFLKKSEKLVTINKGHRLEWYADVQPADLSEFGVKPGSFIFTCIANARRMKGVKYLMQALKLLPPGMDIHLLMVGKGLETPGFRKMADESPYGDRVVFTGFRTNPLEIDKASDVFVLASIFGESITKSVIEAMAVGTAPLITNIPGNKYLIEHAKSGIMVPPRNPQALADAMKMLYEKRSWVPELAAAAQERIKERLSTDDTIRAYAAFYKDLSSGKNTYRTKLVVL